MKRPLLILLISFFLFCGKEVTAQFNYVPNPSFEEYDSTALLYADSTFYKYLYFPKYWFVPVSYGFLNYFNSNLNNVDTNGSDGLSVYGVPQNPWSYTYPYDGIAQSAFVPFVLSENEGLRNYLETGLLQPLTANETYCVRFFITLEDSTYIAIDQIGAFFSNDSLTHYTSAPPCYLLQTPQVVSLADIMLSERDKWYEISGSFTASGGEQFMTIGNFKVDSSTHYLWLPDVSMYAPGAGYHIDMVSVIECDANLSVPYAGADSTICLGDSVQIGILDTTDGYSFEWRPAEGLSDSTVSNPLAAPSQTTTYVLQQWYYHSFLRTDTVTITVLDCNPPPTDTTEPTPNVFFIPNIFSPNGDGNNNSFNVRGENIAQVNIKIYNRWGLLVFETKSLESGWDGQYNGSDCPEGVYFSITEITFNNAEKVIKKGNLTLIR